jgi:hypothetical protein
MDLFADIGENGTLDLIAVVLLMALWGSATVLIDRWVWSDRAGHRKRQVDGDRLKTDAQAETGK